MEYVKLGDLYKIASGGTPSRRKNEYYENGNIAWIKTGDLKQRDLVESSEYITELGLENSSAKYFPANTVLIAMYGATIGSCSILRIEASTNQACAAFTPIEGVIPEYLYYFFKFSKKKIISLGVGGAQPNISGTILKGIKIPICDLSVQQKIVNILDKAQFLINKRKEQIEACDELIKSLFYEMFGSMNNKKTKWDVELLSNVAEYFIGLTYKPADVSDTGTVVLRSSNIQNNHIDFGDIVRVSKEVKDKLFVQKGDILMCSRNGSARLVGKVAQIPELDENMTFGAFMTIIRSRYNTYLLNYFRTEAFRVQIASGATTTINQITKRMLDGIYLPIPPLNLQNKFAEQVEQIEKQKELLQKSLIELENNFNSLMQRAFKGEL